MPATRSLSEAELLDVADVIMGVVSDFYPLHMWPTWAKIALFEPHKNRDQRRQLFLFLVHNGMAPHIAHQLVLIHDTYDGEAIRSMNDLYNQWLHNPGSITQRIYSIEHKRPI